MFHAASAQKYVDASTLTIIGRTCPMEGHPYYRVAHHALPFRQRHHPPLLRLPGRRGRAFHHRQPPDRGPLDHRTAQLRLEHGPDPGPATRHGSLRPRKRRMDDGRCGTSRITGPARQHHRRAHGRTAQGVHALPAGVERTADAGDRRGRRCIRHAARIALQAPRDRLRIERHPRSFGQPPGHDLSCAHEPHDGHRVRQSGVQRQLHAPARIRAGCSPRPTPTPSCSTPFRTPPRR